MAQSRPCKIDGCGNPRRTRGWCQTHYSRWHRTGSVESLPVATPEERFLSKINKTPGCWEWTGTKNPDGYGMFALTHTKPVGAHRFSYELHVGKIPDGLVIDHICHNRACVRPDHLRPVTTKQNGEHRRGAARNSATGIRGVRWDKQLERWKGSVGHNGVVVHVGYFHDIKECEAAVIRTRLELHTHSGDLQEVSLDGHPETPC